ncbi:MAG: cohesin domain-containing protein [Anaerolineae bacterium]
MKARTVILITLVLLFAALLGGAAVVWAQEPGEPLRPVHPTLTVAHPRAGIATTTQAGVENFMIGEGTSEENPLVTLPARRRFRLRAAYEAVFFPLTAGWAKFEMEVYRIRADGTWELLGADQKLIVGFGPRLKSGGLHVDVGLNEPGVYYLAIVSRTSARAIAAPEEVVDEDQVIVVVIITGEEAQEDLIPVGRKLPGPLPLMLTPTPVPIPAIRLFQVATPRAHILSPALGAVENFDQGHGQTVVLRVGDSIRFQSSYEMVWFEGATGTATTSLTILRGDNATDRAPIGEDRQEFRDLSGPYRERGNLHVDVPFNDPGIFTIVARIRTEVETPAATDARGTVDEDEVVVRVIVLGTPQGAIAGTVTAEDTGLPLVGVPIYVADFDTGRPWAKTRTQEDGSYIVDGLRTGDYMVWAAPEEQNYLPEYYDDAPTKEEADPVHVEEGQTTPDIDFALTPGGIISGRVIEDTGALTLYVPLGGVHIKVGDYETNRVVATTRTLDDGTYAVDQLPAGTYWVYAGNPDMNLIGEYYDDKLTLDEADPVEVEEGQETPNINFALAYGGSISGRVLPEEGPISVTPFFAFKVEAQDFESGEVVGKAETDRMGYYKIPSLPEGTYRVYAYDDRGLYIPEYYDDVTDPEDATPVSVEPGENTPDINFRLARAGHPLVHIEPAVSSPLPGDTFTVTIAIDNVQDLGNFELEMTYYTSVVHVEDVALGDFLGSTGRQVTPLGPEIDNETGLMRFGAFSVGEEPGPTGSGALAIVTLSAQANGESPLHLQNVQLTNTEAKIIPARLRDGRVSVGDCIFGDFDCDCDVDIVDVMQVASRWGSEEGDPDYDPTYDLDHDGDIDIVDVALVAAAWGDTCDEVGAAQASELKGKVLTAEVKGSAAALTTGLRIEPPSTQAVVGQSLTLQVMIDEAVDLSGFEFHLTYDPAVLRAEGAALGPFLGSTGRSTSPLGPQIDNVAGTLYFGGFSFGHQPGPDGSGLLAEITFNVVGSGQSAVQFQDAQITRTDGGSQSGLPTQGGYVEVGEGGPSAYLPLILREAS